MRPVVRTHRRLTNVDARHAARARVRHGGRERTALGRRIGLAGLQLQRLQHRLVVLILVLQDHVIDVAVAEQRIIRLEVDAVQPLQDALTNLGHRRERGRERG